MEFQNALPSGLRDDLTDVLNRNPDSESDDEIEKMIE
jgi:hypothetical protein